MDYTLIIKSLISEVVKSIGDLLRGKIDASSKSSNAEVNLRRHLVEAMNWSKDIQFFGMSQPESTQESTISLTIDSIPREFRGTRADTKKFGEDSLLMGGRHTMILGSPGSGKTTTIKRLVNTIPFEKPVSHEDIWQYPFVGHAAQRDDLNRRDLDRPSEHADGDVAELSARAHERPCVDRPAADLVEDAGLVLG